MYYMIMRGICIGYFIICTLVRLYMIFFYIFVLFGSRWVLVIGIWLCTYKGGIVILVIGCIGLGLGFVIGCILFCLLGGGVCRLGIFPHFVLG